MQSRSELACGRWEGDAVLLPVRVQPRARRLTLGPVLDARVKLALTAPPLDGKANAQARSFIATQFGVSTSKVTLLRGGSSRDKLFRIDQPKRLPPEILKNERVPRAK